MMGRQLLVLAGYVEMGAAALFAGIALLYGPLVLGHTNQPDARLIELRLYAVVFCLGALLLVSAACVRPEGQAPRRLAHRRFTPRFGATPWRQPTRLCDACRTAAGGPVARPQRPAALPRMS